MRRDPSPQRPNHLPSVWKIAWLLPENANPDALGPFTDHSTVPVPLAEDQRTAEADAYPERESTSMLASALPRDVDPNKRIPNTLNPWDCARGADTCHELSPLDRSVHCATVPLAK
jgi:hypothetical protein